MTMHYTSDAKVTLQSLIACSYSQPHPRWSSTHNREAVTCGRCKAIMSR